MSVRDYAIITMMAAWRASEYDLPLHRRYSSCELANLAIADVDAMMRAMKVERRRAP